MFLEEEQEDPLVCNYVTILILYSMSSISRFRRYWASFIDIMSFHGITLDTAYEIQYTLEMGA